MNLGSKEARLFERVSGAAIANKAVLKCIIAGVPLTVENAIYSVGDFLDPEDKDYVRIIEHIQDGITEVVEMSHLQKKFADGAGQS